MRTLLGRLLRYKHELKELKQQVAVLSWDEPYGMYTRPAFLAFCHTLPLGYYPLGFLDLNAIGELNLRFGYKAVDQRIQRLFHVWRRPGEIAARWYSGDEIVLLFPKNAHPQARLQALQAAAARCDLSFAGASGIWDTRTATIEEAVDALADQTRL